MPNTFPSPPSLIFYPSYCYSLSPTYSAWARLLATDVHALEERQGFEGQDLYFHLNHPIRWIRLVGVIVAVDVYPTRWILLLDDSSGATIEVTCSRQVSAATVLKDGLEPTMHGQEAKSGRETAQVGLTATGRTVDLSGVDVGVVVKVKGGVGVFRGAKQVVLERISITATTSEEVAAWAETTAFRRDILSTPWVVSERDQEKARRKVANEAHEKKLLAELKRRKRQRMESKNDNNREERKSKADILRRETSEAAKMGKSHEKKPKKGGEETMEASDKVVKPVVQGKFDALGF